MLQPGYIKAQKKFVVEGLKKRGFKGLQLIDEVIELDENRKKIQLNLDRKLENINNASREIGKLFSEGKTEEGNAKREKVTSLKSDSKELEASMKEVEDALRSKLILIPNVPHESVPAGMNETDNELLREGGKKPILNEHAKPHWELGIQYDIIDFELGNKLTGSGFPVFKGKGAQLQRALLNFFITKAKDVGYLEIIPPLLVNADSAFGTGQLPDKDGQMYEMKDDPYFLIPTAEVPITNIYRDEILLEKELPVKLVGYTPCFRREAGSYGKDVRGLNRVHQFDKVEVVQIEHPDKSYTTLDKMVSYVEEILKELKLPYRILRLCAGDLGFTSALTFDFEVYSAAQHKWLEVSSVSNFEEFQANRMKIRFKDKKKKTRNVHTLNGSALAVPRIIAALLENNQTEDGINFPEVLHPFLGFTKIN